MPSPEILCDQHHEILRRMFAALEQIAEAERAGRVIVGMYSGARGIDGSHDRFLPGARRRPLLVYYTVSYCIRGDRGKRQGRERLGSFGPPRRA